MKNDNAGRNYTSWRAGANNTTGQQHNRPTTQPANNTTGLEQFFEPEVLDAEDIKLIIEKELN
jgi:hypothetical protein